MAIDITDQARRVQYVGSGTGPYAFAFEVLAQTDIEVYQGTTLLALTTDYTVSLNADGTGSVTTVASMTGSTVTIAGARPYARITDFSTGGDFFAATVNEELDSHQIQLLQLRDSLDRGIRAPVTDDPSLDMTLPVAATRAGKFMAFDANGELTTSAGTGTDNSLRTDLAASSGSTLVGFLQAGTGAASRSVQSKFRDVISVKDFGAVGDGVTDDSTAQTNTYAALPSDGGQLTYPVGTYLTTSQLDFSDSRNVIISGQGMGASNILVSGASAFGTTPFFGAIKLSTTSAGWKTVSDLKIFRNPFLNLAAAIANDHGIVLGPVQNIVNIERVTIENMGADAILHRGNSASVNVIGCSLRENHFGYAINGSGAAAAIQDLMVKGCAIYGNNGGILISSSVGVTIVGNDVEGAGSGAVAIAAGVPNNPMLNVQANNVYSYGNRYGLPATCNATKVAILNGQNILSVGDSFSIGANTKTAVEIGANARNVVLIAPQISAAATVGTSIGISILAGAQNTVILNPNFGNTFNTEISDAGTNTIVLRGPAVTAGVLALTGILSATVGSGAALYAKRSGSGDQLRVSPAAAGSGATIDVVNNAETDYEPLSIFGEDITFQVRTGAGTASAAQVLSNTSVSQRRKLYPVKDDGTANTTAGIYGGNGAPNNANGSNGDFYFRDDGTVAGNTVIYHKEGGSWVALTTT